MNTVSKKPGIGHDRRDFPMHLFSPNSVHPTVIMASLAQTPSKAHTDIHPPSSSKRPWVYEAHELNSPDHDRAKIVLQDLDRTDELSPAPSPSKNEEKAFQSAQSYDTAMGLSPSKTTISRPLQFYPEKRETFFHENFDRRDQATVQNSRNRIERWAAYRVFLDCLYAKFGYVASSKDAPQRTLAPFACPNLKGQFTPDEKKTYIKYFAVMSHYQEIPNMTAGEAKTLVGKKADVKRGNDAHHVLEVDAVAVHLKRMLKYEFAGDANETKRSAIVKAFRWLTNHGSFDDAIKSEDGRLMTANGIKDSEDSDDEWEGQEENV